MAFLLWRDLGAAWEIGFLATAADARGRGLMSKLLDCFLRHLPEGKEIWLEVHEQNLAAIQLYQKMGFREVGKRPRYYADGGSAILLSFGPNFGPNFG
jgi:[ribosomal protein S18]-alanine N-acetyltransferase